MKCMTVTVVYIFSIICNLTLLLEVHIIHTYYESPKT